MYKNINEEMQGNKKDNLKMIMAVYLCVICFIFAAYFAGKFDARENMKNNIESVE